MKSWAEYDKVKVAWHEAGHIVVAATLDGRCCGGYIAFESNGGDDSLGEWDGQSYGLGTFSAASSVAGIGDTHRARFTSGRALWSIQPEIRQ